MAALPRLSLMPHVDAPPPRWIAALRVATLACRAGRRRSPLEACATLDPDAPEEVRSRALAAALPNLMARRPVLWRPDATGLSFDEAWLRACAVALARGDRASFRFLTERRLRPHAGSILRTLLVGLESGMSGHRLERF